MQACITKFFKPLDPSKADQFHEWLFQKERADREKRLAERQAVIKAERDRLRALRREKEKKRREAAAATRAAQVRQRAELARRKLEGQLVIPGIFIGGRLAAQNWEWFEDTARNHNLTCVLNCTPDVRLYFDDKSTKSEDSSSSATNRELGELQQQLDQINSDIEKMEKAQQNQANIVTSSSSIVNNIFDSSDTSEPATVITAAPTTGEDGAAGKDTDTPITKTPEWRSDSGVEAQENASLIDVEENTDSKTNEDGEKDDKPIGTDIGIPTNPEASASSQAGVAQDTVSEEDELMKQLENLDDDAKLALLESIKLPGEEDEADKEQGAMEVDEKDEKQPDLAAEMLQNHRLKRKQIAEHRNEFKINYMRIPIADDRELDITKWFPIAVNFIKECVDRGESILVHCREGRSRSVSMVVAYLVQEKGMPLIDAFKLVKEKIPDENINDGFKKQLMELEEQVHGTQSVDYHRTRSRSCKQKITYNDNISEITGEPVSRGSRSKRKRQPKKAKIEDDNSEDGDYEDFEPPSKTLKSIDTPTTSKRSSRRYSIGSDDVMEIDSPTNLTPLENDPNGNGMEATTSQNHVTLSSGTIAATNNSNGTNGTNGTNGGKKKSPQTKSPKAKSPESKSPKSKSASKSPKSPSRSVSFSTSNEFVILLQDSPVKAASPELETESWPGNATEGLGAVSSGHRDEDDIFVQVDDSNDSIVMAIDAAPGTKSLEGSRPASQAGQSDTLLSTDTSVVSRKPKITASTNTLTSKSVSPTASPSKSKKKPPPPQRNTLLNYFSIKQE